MKKIISICRSSFLPLAMAATLFFSCEGPKGAQGTTGPQGPAGPAGTAQCAVCHNNSTALFAKQLQYSLSLHATGTAYDEGTRNQCAACHSSQGFLEVIKTGADTTVAGFPDAVGPNCRTCHTIHTKYDSTDWALTYTAPVKLREGGATVDLGKGNLCGKCHQSRTISPKIDLTSQNTYNITSSRFGPHHGPMANVFSGQGGYKVNGSTPYTTDNPHATNALKNTCVDCHMADATLYASISGHTMKMAAEDGTQKIEPCKACHTTMKKFEDKTASIAADLAALKAKLVEKKWLDPATDLVTNGFDSNNKPIAPSTSKPLTVTQEQAAAIYNYMLLSADRSNGAHNPRYVSALIKNSIEVLNK